MKPPSAPMRKAPRAPTSYGAPPRLAGELDHASVALAPWSGQLVAGERGEDDAGLIVLIRARRLAHRTASAMTRSELARFASWQAWSGSVTCSGCSIGSCRICRFVAVNHPGGSYLSGGRASGVGGAGGTMWRGVVGVTTLALVLSACGGSESAESSGTARPSVPATSFVTGRDAVPASAPGTPDTQAALDAWASFPVERSPRPIVLTSDPVTAPASGFPSTSSKEAFARGSFVEPSALPEAPASAGGYPVIGALDAFGVMRDEGSPPGGGPASPIEPLSINRIEFGSSTFSTDRGVLNLPAWMFFFDGLPEPAAVLAVAPEARFDTPAESRHRLSLDASVEPDDRTVTVRFVGEREGTGPCTADYTIDHAESSTGVAIRVLEHPHPPNEGVACTALGYMRQATIRLEEPIGSRVLIDATTKAPIRTQP